LHQVTEAKKAFESISRSEALRDAQERSAGAEGAGFQKKSSHASRAASRDASRVTSYKDIEKSSAAADGLRKAGQAQGKRPGPDDMFDAQGIRQATKQAEPEAADRVTGMHRRNS